MLEILIISYKLVHHRRRFVTQKSFCRLDIKCQNIDQKRARVEESLSTCALFEKYANLLRHFYKPETTQQSMEWKHSGPKVTIRELRVLIT